VRYILALCCLIVSGLANAGPDAYPERPLRILVGYPAGGAVDLIARVLGDKLAPALGQSIVVENRPGATGNIAAEMAARAPADGYTLYMGTSINAVSANLFKKLGYDPVRDFAPVANVVEVQTVLASSLQFPGKTLKGLVEYAKANPGKVTYATTGEGSTPHLTAVLLSNLAGIKMVHVPYKGGPNVLTDLMAGRVDISFSNPVSVVPQIKNERLRALAVVGLKRSPELPGVPTMAEEGYPHFDINAWYGLMAPAGTPEPIIARLNAEVLKIMAMPDVREKLAKVGMLVLPPNTPAEFSAQLKKDVAMYGKLLKEAGVAPQ